jgi:hypothetical protein
MRRAIRTLAKRLLRVDRVATYYLPWIARPDLECRLVLSNVEARFKVGYTEGPFPAVVEQHAADGTMVRRYDVTLQTPTDVVEVALVAAGAGHGMVTVSGERLHSDLYVTLSDGETYTATHGRQEWIERYPLAARLAYAAVGGVLALAGRTIPAFRRDQYVYQAATSRSHLLLLNLGNITNRIRVVPDGDDARARLVTIPALGAHLLDVATLVPPGDAMRVRRMRLAGNAWFNLYLVGAGPRDLAGPLSLMHVK